MANYGVKISKAGYDYDDGDRRLIFNSNYPLLKIAASGTGTLSLSSGSGSKTVYTHSLGYEPFFFLWISYIDTSTGSEVTKKRLCSWSYYVGLQLSDLYQAWVDTSTLELSVTTNPSVYGGSGSATLDYVYVIFYDPLS